MTPSRRSANASVSHYPLEADGDYCRAAETTQQEFAIVVIDGRDRVNCARHSLSALESAGVIVWITSILYRDENCLPI